MWSMARLMFYGLGHDWYGPVWLAWIVFAPFPISVTLLGALYFWNTIFKPVASIFCPPPKSRADKPES